MTQSWHNKNLGDALLAFELLHQIETQFQAEFNAADQPEEMALFIRHVSEGRLHCEVWVYFSPRASHLAQLQSARPCARPASQGLGLLAGPDGCWKKLFPTAADDH